VIETGQILDKYELIEKVGQGGMAVVYRGLDRSLKRQVAVKVLHDHLAEHAESRERFEREAQAVAKLRHENILEIFDYSGPDSSESFIVTEFIDGQTLKEFITDHRIGYPEVGAMICAQVCRALAHAHSFGVLHRDVKPENIMIRSDGVVKLTDFGIAQMVDSHRLTVTGQLLGSPAYMSPEHIEGGQLDFRTDVFAVGIVLYQLVTNELPFNGRNPHEILKRIADCEFEDPRTKNPRVSDGLARIILRAMARDKDDRFSDTVHMLNALEEFLHTSGLDDYAGELQRFFAAPPSYEMALRERLIPTLVARGREQLHDNRARALALFNRVLTLEPDNAEVLAEIDRLGRRRRGLRTAALFAAVAVAGACAVAVKLWLAPAPPGLAIGAGPTAVAPATDVAPRETPLRATAAGTGSDGAEPSTDTGHGDGGASAPTAGATGDEQAGRAAPATDRRDRRPSRRPDRPSGSAGRDAEEPEAVVARAFSLKLMPAMGSDYRLGSGPWTPYPGRSVSFEVPAGESLVVSYRNKSCCAPDKLTIGPDREAGDVVANLELLPASVVPTCRRAGATVVIDGRPARLGKKHQVFFPGTITTRSVSVAFYNSQRVFKEAKVTVSPGTTETVECD